MQTITLHQRDLSLLMKRISSDQTSHVKPLMRAIVSAAMNYNAIIIVSSGNTTSTKLMEEIIMETVIILEMVFKRG